MRPLFLLSMLAMVLQFTGAAQTNPITTSLATLLPTQSAPSRLLWEEFQSVSSPTSANMRGNAHFFARAGGDTLELRSNEVVLVGQSGSRRGNSQAKNLLHMKFLGGQSLSGNRWTRTVAG